MTVTTSYTVDALADFTVAAQRTDLTPSAAKTLKRNVLDSVACAIGALDGEPIASIRAHAEQFSGRPSATVVGGGQLSVDQAAFVNTVLVRYPDLLDTFLTEGGLCHPADNFGTVLAVAEHADASGSDFLLALALAYEIQCRFSVQVPLMARGLNHALQLAMSTSAAAAKLLNLDAGATADAVAAATVDNVSLAAVHAEPVSNWKGISPAITAMRAVYVTFWPPAAPPAPRRSSTDPMVSFDYLINKSISTPPTANWTPSNRPTSNSTVHSSMVRPSSTPLSRSAPITTFSAATSITLRSRCSRALTISPAAVRTATSRGPGPRSRLITT